MHHIVKTGHAEIRFFQRIDDAVQTMPTAAGYAAQTASIAESGDQIHGVPGGKRCARKFARAVHRHAVNLDKRWLCHSATSSEKPQAWALSREQKHESWL
ncbi:protein of unknown function (plasmid) [Caballeronia sp. S22]